MANAALLQVWAPGIPDDLTGQDVPGAVLWQGQADAYLTSRTLTTAGADGATVNVVRALVVPSEGMPDLPPRAVVTFRVRGDAQDTTARVRDVRRVPAPVGVPVAIDTTKLWLEDA